MAARAEEAQEVVSCEGGCGRGCERGDVIRDGRADVHC